MPEFNSIEDLAKHINTNFGRVATSQQQLVAQIRIAGDRLVQLLKREIEAYFQRVPLPKVYIRTDPSWWMESIIAKPPKINGNFISMEITFDPALAWHQSYIYPNDETQMGYVPWLMDVGWNIEDKVGFIRPRFTSFSGTHYIGKAIQSFKQEYPNFNVAVWFNGKLVKEGDY